MAGHVLKKTAEQLITENLDIWTTAIEQKSASGRGSSKKFSLHGIKKLRELILELAVRGKLVPQDENDEPALVLLERIAAEKAQLVKDKKIKKSKALPEISEDEKPFQLPKGWEWTRLAEVGLGSTGKTPSTKQPSFFEGTIPFIGPGQITSAGVILNAEKFLSDSGLENSSEALSGDIFMVCIGGSIGKAAIAVERSGFNQQINCMSPIHIASSYLYFALSTNSFYTSVLEKATGSATPIINRGKWEELLVPIAPLEEQQRIVAKVDELMSLCDALEAQTEASITAHQTLVENLLGTLLNPTASDCLERSLAESFTKDWQRISENFDTLFTTNASIDTLKQTILQLAVMGKLVDQDENDEPASKLLERIATEKAQLIADKKIKKQKPLPAITDEEKPFAVPNGWEWVRFGDIYVDLKYGTSQRSDYGVDGEAILRIPNVVKGFVCIEDLKFSKLTDKEKKDLKLVSGDLLFIRSNGSLGIVGRCTVVDRDLENFGYAGYLVRARLPQEHLLPKFVALAMKTTHIREQVEKPIRTTSGVKNINSTELGKLSFTMPSLEEQHRIVAKVDELMALCDQLKARLTDAQTIQLNLADSMTQQALYN